MRRKLVLAPAGALALVAGGCGGEGQPGWPDELVLTLTPSSEAQQLIEDADPLAAMLAQRLSAYPEAPEDGITVEAEIPTDYAGVIVALEAGQADIAGGLGPQQMVQAEEQAGAELVLQSERFGGLTYVSQWFTNDPDTYCTAAPVADPDGFRSCNGVGEATSPDDGPIGEEAIARVAGAQVAYVDQGSASGHLIPALQLFEAGVDPQTGVEPRFAGGHDNTVLAVYRGDAQVGVSFSDARADVVDQAEDVGDRVVVFAWSPPIPNDGFAVAGELPADLRDAIVEAFLHLAATEQGMTTLQDLYNIDNVVPVDSAAYDPIRTAVAELGELLED